VEESSKPSEVRVRIATTPSDAKIFINGIEFPNPMDAFRPRSLDPVRIRVEKRGYRSIEQVAVFDQQRAFSFELAKGRGVEKRTAIVENQSTSSVSDRMRPKPTDKTEGVASQIDDSRVKTFPNAPKTGTDISDRPETNPESGHDDIYRGPSGAIRNEF
jgi:hypothetical protein